MTISHPPHPEVAADNAVVFAELLGTFCSVCAPNGWTKDKVEERVNAGMKCDGWEAIDKSTIGLGSPTPNPCNQYPDRKHWFMIRNP